MRKNGSRPFGSGGKLGHPSTFGLDFGATKPFGLRLVGPTLLATLATRYMSIQPEDYAGIIDDVPGTENIFREPGICARHAEQLDNGPSFPKSCATKSTESGGSEWTQFRTSVVWTSEEVDIGTHSGRISPTKHYQVGRRWFNMSLRARGGPSRSLLLFRHSGVAQPNKRQASDALRLNVARSVPLRRY